MGIRNNLYLIITVDTEDLNTPFTSGEYLKSIIFSEFSSKLISGSFVKNDIKATFFVSVYEYFKIGKVMGNLLKFLVDNGHEVSLHTHPIYCWKKEHMYQYPISEQVEIIKYGTELIKKWAGEYPIAHRAGAYGINQDTLKALCICKIPVDSSMFYGHPNCKVVWSRNKVVEKDGLIEVPITGFYRDVYLKIGFKSIRIKRNFIKTDLDWATLDELHFFVKDAKKHNVKVMNLFMHSYSLLKWDKNFTDFQPDQKNIEKLRGFLEFIKNDKDLKIITMREFYDIYKKDKSIFEGSDHVPCIREEISIWEPLLKAIRKFAT